MRPPRRPSPERVPLPLQRIQLLVKPSLASLRTDRHVIQAVVAESDKPRFRACHSVGCLVALEVRDDGGLGLVVAEQLPDFAGVVDEAERRIDTGGVDVTLQMAGIGGRA